MPHYQTASSDARPCRQSCQSANKRRYGPGGFEPTEGCSSKTLSLECTYNIIYTPEIA